ncbi:hypothetical protein [Paracoccus aerodenitrificans]|uniref:hypothetical protein n=1 Tax=Paracoccus aerodenitrificans TaxID=3017781 RepID=UPI0022F074B2|nr:hypothetical protein [Paracoccus aerodenitrificans]WBU62872.1 hypothetical protein PAE61_10885 [Paracoccus aerodenitrificans]
MTQQAPGRWKLAGVFLAIALPLMLAIWWFGIVKGGNPTPASAEIALSLVPVLAAIIAGMVWRRHLPAYPGWAMRRPYSWLMAGLLFVSQTLIFALMTFFMIILPQQAHSGDLTGKVLTTLVMLFQISTLPIVLGVLFMQFLLCLLQTEAGLFLGVWLMGKFKPNHDSPS